jgi:CHAT domain
MKQEQLPAQRPSPSQRERILLKKLDELIRTGQLLKAADLSLALVRLGKPSRDAQKLFRRLCLQLELQARKAFDTGNGKELRYIEAVTSQWAAGSIGRIPIALRAHLSVKRLLIRHLRRSRHPAEGKAKPDAQKTKTKAKSPVKKNDQAKARKPEEIRFGGAVAPDVTVASPSPRRPFPPKDYGVIDELVAEPLHSRRGAEESKSAQPPSTAPEADEFPVAVHDAVVKRTPHMDLDTEEPISPAQLFHVLVYADAGPARPGEETEPIVVHIPSEMTSFEVEVELLFTSHFVQIEPSPEFRKKRLVIRRDQATTEKLQFMFMVCHEDELKPTQPAITAIFRYLRRPSGKVTRKVSIKGLKVEARVPPHENQMPTKGPDGSTATMSIAQDAGAPGLVISVLEREDKDGRNFDFIVDSATLPERWSGKWTLRQKTDDIVKAAMDTFQKASPPAVKLKAAGIEMFAASPPEFQKMFWKMVDKKKLPRHILVISEEPYIPWELMVPQRRLPNGTFETRPALGVEFCVGRWITDKYVSPPQKIGFPQVYVVAPDYPVGRQLKYSAAEVETIKECFGSVEQISPALVKNIDDSLAKKGAALLHFVCHGKAAIPQTISLEQDQEQLSCWDIKALNGFLSSFEKAKTFVFLNACEVGRAAPELVGIGGFGNSFASIGASGVVAPLWSVDDEIAHRVADLFYNRVITRPTIPFSDILRDIRAKAYAENGEDTWAAYCFYGDPMAALV